MPESARFGGVSFIGLTGRRARTGQDPDPPTANAAHVDQSSYGEAAVTPFSAAQFAENPDPRCACVLVLDRSASMAGKKIAELNAGLQQFRDELLGDELARRRVEIAVVPFGPVVRGSTFEPAERFAPGALSAAGGTPTGEAVNYALDLLEERKQLYRDHGILRYRPWVILITDGEPTDAYRTAARRVRDGEANKAWTFFPIGVEGANAATLREFSDRAVNLRGHSFREFFQWLSASMSTVSRSTPGGTLRLPSASKWTIEA